MPNNDFPDLTWSTKIKWYQKKNYSTRKDPKVLDRKNIKQYQTLMRQFHSLIGLDGMYISARKADIIDLSTWASLSVSPWSLLDLRISAHRSCFTLSIFKRKSPSGFQQWSWSNLGGVIKTPFLYAEKPRSTFEKSSTLSLKISVEK